MLVRLALGALVIAAVGADDPKKPHDHQGKLDKFKLGPPPALTPAELEMVKAKKTLSKTVPVEGGARAFATFDVQAPPELVWQCINDLEAYPRMVPGVAETKIYGKSARSGVKQTYVTWTLKLLGYSVRYHLDFKYSPSLSAAAFSLDYNRMSDIDDTVRASPPRLVSTLLWQTTLSKQRLIAFHTLGSLAAHSQIVGYWHVESIEDGAASRVTYAAALLLKGWFPKPVVDFLLSTTLGRATSWVGKEAMARKPKFVSKQVKSTKKPGSSKDGCHGWGPFRRCPPPPPPPPVEDETFIYNLIYGSVVAMTVALIFSTFVVY
eukprot:scaffold88482_cov32-Tisochrysis_lutea.AAC.1